MALFSPRAVGELEAVIQAAFKWKIQSHRRGFNAGNLLHRGDALLKETMESIIVVIARIIERNLGRQDICSVKAGRQRLQVYESADEQPGACQQDNREHHFTGNQGLANATMASARSCSGSGCRKRRADVGPPDFEGRE